MFSFVVCPVRRTFLVDEIWLLMKVPLWELPIAPSLSGRKIPFYKIFHFFLEFLSEHSKYQNIYLNDAELSEGTAKRYDFKSSATLFTDIRVLLMWSTTKPTCAGADGNYLHGKYVLWDPHVFIQEAVWRFVYCVHNVSEVFSRSTVSREVVILSSP